MTKVVVTRPGEAVAQGITVLTWRSSTPAAAAPPPDVGLVQIQQTMPTELIPGPPGADSVVPGPPGVGVPAGGAADQVLTKLSSADYDTNWQTPTGGAGGGIPEAPTDGQQYGRTSGNWSVVVPNPDISGLAAKSYVDSQDAALNAAITLKAPLVSPVFTGNPTAPTPAAADNDTSIATTAFVKTAIAGAAAATFIGVDPPLTPSVGQMWWDSDSGRLYIYYNDGDTSQWVEAVTSPVDLTGFVREEWGDWTPRIAFNGVETGIVHASQLGRWRRAGKLMKLWFDVTLSNKGAAAGAVQVLGCPIVSASLMNNAGSVVYASSLASATVNVFGCYMSSGNGVIVLTAGRLDGTAMVGANNTQVSNTTRFVGAVEYEVA